MLATHHPHDLVWERTEILQLKLILAGLLVLFHVDCARGDEGAASLSLGVDDDFYNAERIIRNSIATAHLTEGLPSFKSRDNPCLAICKFMLTND